VLGQPIGHSLSPALHRAAYAALALSGWRYDAIECDDVGLPGFVAGLDAEWAGLSVTMPGKRAALECADSATDRATAVGAANTLVHDDGGTWRADCTDVDGVTGALRGAGFTTGSRAVLLGGGGTACAALAALAEVGVSDVSLVVREARRAGDAVRCAERVGVDLNVVGRTAGTVREVCSAADVVISTVPAGAADPLAADLAAAPCVLDVIYHPWPTVLAAAVHAAGGRLATGLDMLLHQAFGQVELFTGQPAPRAAMRAALVAAAGYDVPLAAADATD
jgi:shikimate dehydrogenase